MSDKDLPVLEHLTELRKRIIIILIAVTVTTIVLYNNISILVEFLKQPMNMFDLKIVFFSLTEGFTTRIKISFLAAIILMSPLIFYQAMMFINPGLTKKEKKVVYWGILSVSIFFILGNIFAYLLLLPHVLYFLISYAQGYLTATLSGDKYFSFIGIFCIAIGIMFILPLLLVFAGKLTVLSHKTLRKIRIPIILAIVSFEGLMVPTLDFYSIGITAIPLLALYELSIWVVFFMERKKVLKEAISKACGGVRDFLQRKLTHSRRL